MMSDDEFEELLEEFEKNPTQTRPSSRNMHQGRRSDGLELDTPTQPPSDFIRPKSDQRNTSNENPISVQTFTAPIAPMMPAQVSLSPSTFIELSPPLEVQSPSRPAQTQTLPSPPPLPQSGHEIIKRINIRMGSSLLLSKNISQPVENPLVYVWPAPRAPSSQVPISAETPPLDSVLDKSVETSTREEQVVPNKQAQTLEASETSPAQTHTGDSIDRSSHLNDELSATFTETNAMSILTGALSKTRMDRTSMPTARETSTASNSQLRQRIPLTTPERRAMQQRRYHLIPSTHWKFHRPRNLRQ